MQVLRLKIYQPSGHYRIPFTYQRRHTYPIPPYSTVIGLFCNLLGIKPGTEEDQDKNLQKIKNGLSLAIYGKFKSITTEYTWLRNLAVKSHQTRFGRPEQRSVSMQPEHIGGQMPTKIDVLNDNDLLIYVSHTDLNFLNKLLECFTNPSNRTYPVHLGRAEDLIVIKDAKIEELTIDSYVGKLDYFYWLPHLKSALIPKETDNGDYENFFKNTYGTLFRMPTYYRIAENGVRNFEYIQVKLVEGKVGFVSGTKPLKIWQDIEEKIPIFLAKLR
ncbi:MAG: type I-B CRISPR-associated protein Cas5b [candidate division WOR-3 bacterium]